MHYLHAMVRIENLEASLDFYTRILGLQEIMRKENEKGRYTAIFLKAPGDEVDMSGRKAPILELTYNWPAPAGDSEKYAGGRNFGHLAYAVENLYEYCARLVELGVVISRPPRDGHLAFIRSPEGISIELLQIGASLPPQEPWVSMPNIGQW